MSIIQEALKKVQTEQNTDPLVLPHFQVTKREKKERPEVRLPSPVLGTERITGTEDKLRIKLLLMAGIALIILGMVVSKYLQPNHRGDHSSRDFIPRTEVKVIKKTTASQGAAIVTHEIKPDFIDPKPLPMIISKARPSAPNFALNGIMYLESGPRAIINNTVVEAGDSIRGAKVVNIGKTSVTLLFEDSEIKLTLR